TEVLPVDQSRTYDPVLPRSRSVIGYRSWPAGSAGVRTTQVQPAVLRARIPERNRNVPPHAEVQGQFVAHLPVVLNEETVILFAFLQRQPAHGSDRIRISEEKVGEMKTTLAGRIPGIRA